MLPVVGAERVEISGVFKAFDKVVEEGEEFLRAAPLPERF